MDSTHSPKTSFPVLLGGLEVGHATLSLSGPGAVVRGVFQPGPGISRWDEVVDRALETAHKEPDSPLGFVVVDARTGTRVAKVMTLYGPTSLGHEWEIVVRCDSAPGTEDRIEGRLTSA